MILSNCKYYDVIKVLPEAFEGRFIATRSTDTFLDSATNKDVSSVRIKDIELFKGVTEGKIAVFPRYKRQDMQVVENYFKLGFTCYIMGYRDYCKFKKSYIEKCINIADKTTVEGKQTVFKFD